MALGSWRVRELRYHEFAILKTVHPYCLLPDGVLPDARARIIVAERTNPDGTWRIVRHWAAFNAVHLEPLWTEPAEETDPVTAKALLGKMAEILDEDGVTDAFAIIGHADVARVVPLAKRLGFIKIPGALYALKRVIDPRKDS